MIATAVAKVGWVLGSKFHVLEKTITRAARVRCLCSGKLTLHPHVRLSLRFYPNYCKPLCLTSIGFVGKEGGCSLVSYGYAL